jgi:PmbA protein
MEDKFLRILNEKNVSGELMQIQSYRLVVNFEHNRFKGIEEGETSGIAVRVKKDGKFGFSFSTDVTDIERVINRALENAKFSQEAIFDFARNKDVPEVFCFDDEIVNMSRDEIINQGKEAIEYITSLKSGIQAFFSMSKNILEEKIITTSDFSGGFKKSVASAQMGGIFNEEGNFLWVYGSLARSSKNLLNIDMLKDKLKKNLEGAERNVKINSGLYPVIFTPYSSEYLLLPFAIAINGRNVIKGTSVLKDKLNETIFSKNLTIVNDPLMPYAISTAPFDDEGIPSQRKEIISQGKLLNYLTDLYSAKKLNLEPGNASRSLSTLPSPSPSNIVIENGTEKLSDMLKVKKGIIIESLMGVQMGNVSGGEVMGNIDLGYLVENGEIIGRIKDAMISINIVDALKDVVLSEENAWTTGIVSPYILIPSAPISTKL